MMLVFYVVFAIGVVLPFLLTPSYGYIGAGVGLKLGPLITPSSLHSTRHFQCNEISAARRYVVSRENQEEESKATLRDLLRKGTCFSLTAFRSTWRAATGVSLTVLYSGTLAVTGLWIRKIMSAILSFFPAWVGNFDHRLSLLSSPTDSSLMLCSYVEQFRCFLQPFLVLYYAPLFIIRGLTGPTRKRAKAKHDLVVDGWKDAVEFAEKTKKDGYWPIHLNGEQPQQYTD
jgi:hypothetical protein